MDDKFSKRNEDFTTVQFKSATVGLLSREDFRKAQQAMANASSSSSATKTNLDGNGDARKSTMNALQNGNGTTAKRSKTGTNTLSFLGEDDDEDDETATRASRRTSTAAATTESGEDARDTTTTPPHEQPPMKKIKVIKDQAAETDFLPDREREERKRQEEERLRRDWEEEQERMRKEEIEVVYSYWNGTGHRRVMKLTKGTTIREFLERARRELCKKDFPELRGVPADGLMYVKEDLILPYSFTFQDFIAAKARGKSGPLFDFGIREDVRLVADARIETDESHPGKICERVWYEKNKKSFPASRWENYDISKDYGKYTIHDSDFGGR